MKRLIPVFLFLFCLVSYAAASSAAPQGAPGGSKPSRTPEQARQPHKVEQLTKDQFDRLADDEVIDVKGRQINVGELRAKRRQAEAEAPALEKAAADKAKADFEAYRTKFLQEQKAKLDAENAKVGEEVTRWRTQHPSPAQPTASVGDDAQVKAIRDEARQLLERSKTASPAEQEQIERRAGELLQQLEQRKGAVAPKPKPLPQRQTPVSQPPGGAN